MSSGMPDYTKVVRERYGAANSVKWGLAVGANCLTELGSMSGKGIIYGGFLTTDSVASQLNGYPILKVDGKMLEYGSFFTTNKYGLTKEHSYPMYELLYDNVNFIYTVGVMPGITFEESVALLYREWEGDTPTVIGCLIYALM